MIEIYTDGAYNPARRRGGWGAVIVENGARRSLSGWAEHSTSNRMEITAVIEGLSQTPEGAALILYTDSQYVFGTMTQGWKRRANIDLWEKLDEVARKRNVTWRWIEGHNGNEIHDEAHNLANAEAANKAQKEPKTPEAPTLTHVDKEGRPRMVDVTGKPATVREAVARGRIKMLPATLELVKTGGIAKGDVLTVARLAGIMAAKQTAHLIPLCHPILLSNVEVRLTIDEAASVIEIESRAAGEGKTGVEMEAMSAVAVAALTVYDMCKAAERGIQISDIRLVRKSGGKSGTIVLEP